jgi:ribosomal protein L11 methyltransferase
MRDWVEVCVAVTPETEEAVANALFELGSPGVIQKEEGTPDGKGVIAGYLDAHEPIQEKLDAIRTLWDALRRLGLTECACDISVETIPSGDWATAWQKWFKPVPVSDRITVIPPWEEVVVQDDRIVVVIYPGMAFGTGEHETTKLCIRALEREVRPGDRVLDLGTGSAILAIVAARLGARAVTGMDTDPETRENALENIRRNGVADRVQVYTGGIDHPAVAGRYRVIVSNIDVRTLVPLLPGFAGLLEPDGLLILSGVLATEADRLIDALDAQGFMIKRCDTLGEWWSGGAMLRQSQA